MRVASAISALGSEARTRGRAKNTGPREVLNLTKLHQLSPKDLAEIRATASKREKRASMYPAQPRLEHIPIAE